MNTAPFAYQTGRVEGLHCVAALIYREDGTQETACYSNLSVGFCHKLTVLVILWLELFNKACRS